jgi:hypothetical protein
MFPAAVPRCQRFLQCRTSSWFTPSGWLLALVIERAPKNPYSRAQAVSGIRPALVYILFTLVQHSPQSKCLKL